MLTVVLSTGVLLGMARALGECARRLNQPAVVGEVLAGILLGPSLLGKIAPAWMNSLFPQQGAACFVLQGLSGLGAVMFLLTAGLELNLSSVLRQSRTAIGVSAAGIVVPFGLGVVLAGFAPAALGCEPGADPRMFALFFGIALSVSALPMIARTLMDLDLYRTDFGVIVIASAVASDLVGWIAFAALLAMMGVGHASVGVGWTLTLTLLFVVGVLTVGRAWIHRALPWIQAHTSWPSGVMGFALCLTLLGAAATEWIGIHAIFGAFLIGVAIGDSRHLREQTRATIDRFVGSFFAPLFFAGIGLRTDFVTHFDPGLTALVLIVACAGKVLGCSTGGRWSGLSRREAWAIGIALNARGAMEIILGVLALQHGLIGERLFVSLVFMALATAIISGPLVQKVMGTRKPHRFVDFLATKAFVPKLRASTARDAIRELSEAIAAAIGRPPQPIDAAVWARESIMSTGLEHGIAIPHARLDDLPTPLIAVGLSPSGIDFNAQDGEPARIIFLILTPRRDNGVQVQILADIARTFRDARIRDRILTVTSATELVALVRIEGAAAHR